MILVAGGTGFVGTHVVHAFRAAELPVRVLARRPEKQDQLRAWGCEVVQGDLTDPDSLAARRRRVRHRRAPRRDPAGEPRCLRADHGAGDARPRRGREGRRREAPRPHERARHRGGARGDALLPREVGGGAGRQVLRARARDLQAELRLCEGRRHSRAADPHRPLLAGDPDPRPAPHAAGLGGRRGRVLHRRGVVRRGGQPDVRPRRARPAHLGRPARAHPQDARQEAPGVHDAARPPESRRDRRADPAAA